MKARGHALGGIAAAVAAHSMLPQSLPLPVWLWAILGVVGALFPDLDHPHSTISRVAWPLRWLYVLVLSNPITWGMAACFVGAGPGVRRGIVAKVLAGRSAVRALVSHRRLTHSLLGMTLALALPALAYLLASANAAPAWGQSASLMATTVLAAFAAGYLSHLLLDMTTASGVPLLLPWRSRSYWLLPKPLRIHMR